MNIGSENLLVKAEENAEPARQEKADVDMMLVELGRVSDTKGGWLGSKGDAGAGLMFY